jgi:hypothetical protein
MSKRPLTVLDEGDWPKRPKTLSILALPRMINYARQFKSPHPCRTCEQVSDLLLELCGDVLEVIQLIGSYIELKTFQVSNDMTYDRDNGLHLQGSICLAQFPEIKHGGQRLPSMTRFPNMFEQHSVYCWPETHTDYCWWMQQLHDEDYEDLSPTQPVWMRIATIEERRMWNNQ